jgi:mutator protein MutT
MCTNPNLTVVAAVIQNSGKILIAQRKATRRHPGKWEFPGGKVEPGETPPAALRRELGEELGIDAEIGAEEARYTVASTALRLSAANCAI